MQHHHRSGAALQWRPALLGATLAALATLGACATLPPAGKTEPVGFDRDAALGEVNAFRAEHGLQPLRADARLTAVAEHQSAAMAARERMDHAVAGALPARMKQAGYRWSTIAENIGQGYRSYAAAENGWENSPGHRRNLLNPSVTEIGLAAARATGGGRTYWTQTFGAPKP